MVSHETLLSLIKPRGFLEDRKTAFLFWDGAKPLWYQGKLSYRDLWKKSRQFAVFLKKLNVLAGERVGLILPNSPQFLIAYFGILRMGGVAVPISSLYEREQLINVLKDADIRVVVAWDKFYGELDQIKNETNLKKVIVTGPGDALPSLKAKLYNRGLRKKGLEIKMPENSDFAVKFSEFAAMKFTENNMIAHKPSDLAVLLYTSSTTGDPKGIALSHEALFSNAYSCRQLVLDLGMKDGEEVFLAAAPYFHIMGLAAMLHTPLLMRAKTVLIPDPKNFSKMLSAIEYTKATGFVGVPGFYKMMTGILAKHEHDLSSLKVCLSGASRLEEGVKKKFESFCGGKILIGYGMSECGVTHCQRISGAVDEIGVPLEGVEHKIADPDESGVGELCVRGKNVMDCYWNKFTKTVEAFDSFGWLHTGDMARINANNSVTLLGRLDYDFVKGKDGEKIPLGEAEKILLSHPHVIESAVAAVPKENGKFLIKGFVVLRDPETVCGEIFKKQLFELLNKLPANQIPHEIHCLKEIPKSPMGKVLKKVLRASS